MPLIEWVSGLYNWAMLIDSVGWRLICLKGWCPILVYFFLLGEDTLNAKIHGKNTVMPTLHKDILYNE